MTALYLFSCLILWIRIGAAYHVFFWPTSNTCDLKQVAIGVQINAGDCVPAPDGQFASAAISDPGTNTRLRVWSSDGSDRCAKSEAIGDSGDACVAMTGGAIGITGASIEDKDDASKPAPYKSKSHLTNKDTPIVAYAIMDKDGILYELLPGSEHFASFQLLKTEQEKHAYITKYANRWTRVIGMGWNTDKVAEL